MLRQIQTIVGAVIGTLIVIAIALPTLYVDSDRFAAPPLWLLGAQVAAALVVHLLVEAIGYRASPLDPETPEIEARAASARAFTASTVVRVSLCEAVALGSIVAALLVDDGGYVG